MVSNKDDAVAKCIIAREGSCTYVPSTDYEQDHGSINKAKKAIRKFLAELNPHERIVATGDGIIKWVKKLHEQRRLREQRQA